MRYKAVIIVLLSFAKFGNGQQALTDPTYHFSFNLPSGWTFQQFDSAKSFIRFECFNTDSSAVMEVYAIKAENSIDLNRFANFVTSNELLGKSLGRLQDSSKVLINEIEGIKKHYVQRTRRGSRINVEALMLVKKKYGYVIVSRSFQGAETKEAFAQIIESFKVQLPRSFFSWLILLGFIGVCLYGLGLGSKRTIAWIQPLNWGALAYCSLVVIFCFAALASTYLAFQKISLWVSLLTGAIVLLGIRKMPNAEPVIKAYDDAKKKNTAGAYRAFCQNYKSSRRYYKDAKNRMHHLMDDVVKKYKGFVAKHDTPIVRACLAMFEYIKKTDNFQVAAHYTSQNQIKDQTESYKSRGWKVLTASPAFTENKNRKRERFITALINFAFHRITPEDILGFSTVKSPDANQIIFEITYSITTSGSIYSRTKEEHLPDDKKTMFTGVEFKWSLEIKIPQQRDRYRFSFESKPAKEFSSRGEGTDKVYDAMAASAFSDFCSVFIQQSGLLPIVHKSLIEVSVENGQEKRSFKIDSKDILQGLAEFAKTEEGLDLNEVAQEYAGMVHEVASGIANMDFSFDISFDD